MKGFALSILLVLHAVPALAAEPVNASVPPATFSGLLEVKQPSCDCAPIVVLVAGDQRMLVSANHKFLKKLAPHKGETITLEGTVETFHNDETGLTKYVLDADRVVGTAH
ncbi:MAG TPA: hypothetical protein VMV18_10560 [bacterium]|nr:hypothetical protein [bacterium]